MKILLLLVLSWVAHIFFVDTAQISQELKDYVSNNLLKNQQLGSTNNIRILYCDVNGFDTTSFTEEPFFAMMNTIYPSILILANYSGSEEIIKKLFQKPPCFLSGKVAIISSSQSELIPCEEIDLGDNSEALKCSFNSNESSYTIVVVSITSKVSLERLANHLPHDQNIILLGRFSSDSDHYNVLSGYNFSVPEAHSKELQNLGGLIGQFTYFRGEVLSATAIAGYFYTLQYGNLPMYSEFELGVVPRKRKMTLKGLEAQKKVLKMPAHYRLRAVSVSFKNFDFEEGKVELEAIVRASDPHFLLLTDIPSEMDFLKIKKMLQTLQNIENAFFKLPGAYECEINGIKHVFASKLGLKKESFETFCRFEDDLHLFHFVIANSKELSPVAMKNNDLDSVILMGLGSPEIEDLPLNFQKANLMETPFNPSTNGFEQVNTLISKGVNIESFYNFDSEKFCKPPLIFDFTVIRQLKKSVSQEALMERLQMNINVSGRIEDQNIIDAIYCIADTKSPSIASQILTNWRKVGECLTLEHLTQPVSGILKAHNDCLVLFLAKGFGIELKPEINNLQAIPIPVQDIPLPLQANLDYYVKMYDEMADRELVRFLMVWSFKKFVKREQPLIYNIAWVFLELSQERGIIKDGETLKGKLPMVTEEQIRLIMNILPPPQSDQQLLIGLHQFSQIVFAPLRSNICTILPVDDVANLVPDGDIYNLSNDS